MIHLSSEAIQFHFQQEGLLPLSFVNRLLMANKVQGTALIGPVARAMGQVYEVMERGGRQAVKDLWRAGFPMALAGKLATFFTPLSPNQRGIVAVLTLATANLRARITMPEPKPLNIAVIYGSARQARQGIKAARFIMRKLEQRTHHATLVDSQEYPLPFLDKMHKEFEEDTASPEMQSVGRILDAADGFIIVSAEYNHSIPAVLKNLLDHYQSEYLYKPSGIVTYSAGPFGGVRALVNLRAILAELGTPSIPSAFPVSHIHTAFDADGNSLDQAYDERVIKFLDEFEWYVHALKSARTPDSCTNELPVQQQICRNRTK